MSPVVKGVDVERRMLGKSGLGVSLVGLGCNNFGGRIDRDATRRVVHKALDLGITLFDTADIYGNRGGSETALGEVLGVHRKDIILATKFGGPMDEAGAQKGASRRYILSAVEASLKRLKTDWIDLYQMHFPDPETPIEETLRALDDLVQQGKVRQIGHSNFSGAQVAEARAVSARQGLASFVSAQNEYSLLVRDVERDLLPAVAVAGLGFMPYFPLAGGFLTGKYRRDALPPAGTRLAVVTDLAERYLTPANWQILEELRDFCARRNHSMLELAVAWLAAQPQVSSVIAGATRPEQLEENVRALDWRLTPAELAEIDRLTANRSTG